MGGELERHPSLDERFDPAIRIVEHDPSWVAHAADELRRVAGALGALAVRLEHVGSTAVPGLAAKPVLDLQVSVVDIGQRALFVPALEGLGYLFAPAPEPPDFHFFGRYATSCVRIRTRRPRTRRSSATSPPVIPQDRLAYMPCEVNLDPLFMTWMNKGATTPSRQPTHDRREAPPAATAPTRPRPPARGRRG
jgi:GrpB-like predicted nucleotidyltransferase (UPF0157 family)